MLKNVFFQFIRFVLILVVGGGLWFAGLILFTRIIPSSPEETQRTTDGIVIFTGGQTRLKEALALFEQEKGKYLLISGVNPQSTLLGLIESRPDKSKITLGFTALDTSGNALETATWVRTHSIKSLRLITSNYHMPRSLLELRHLLPDVEIIPHPVVGRSFFKEKWWLDTGTLSTVIQEYNKFLFALVRRPLEDLKELLNDETQK
jgi:uncharacterized SAM-binding protein YcdF (DUF218 family)